MKSTVMKLMASVATLCIAGLHRLGSVDTYASSNPDMPYPGSIAYLPRVLTAAAWRHDEAKPRLISRILASSTSFVSSMTNGHARTAPILS